MKNGTYCFVNFFSLNCTSAVHNNSVANLLLTLKYSLVWLISVRMLLTRGNGVQIKLT